MRGLALALSLLLRAGVSAAEAPPCRLDGRLLPAARAVLDAEVPVDAEVLRAMTEGASLRAPEVLSWRAAGGDPALREERMNAWIRSRAPDAQGARCAVVTDGARAGVALVPRAAEVIERTADDGALRWQVALPAGATDAAVLIAREGGAVERVTLDEAGRAAARVEGAATLQVVLSRAGDPQVWARWTRGAPLTDTAEPVLAARDVVRAINALRARAGVTALRADLLLARVASSYAETLAAARQVAHVMEGGDATARMARAGLRADLVAEDLSRAPTLDGAFSALTRSPTHRTNLVEARVDAVGVGVADADGQVYLVVLMASRPGLSGATP